MTLVYGFTADELFEIRKIVDEVGTVEKLEQIVRESDLQLENIEFQSQIRKLKTRLERIKKLSEELG